MAKTPQCVQKVKSTNYVFQYVVPGGKIKTVFKMMVERSAGRELCDMASLSNFNWVRMYVDNTPTMQAALVSPTRKKYKCPQFKAMCTISYIQNKKYNKMMDFFLFSR